MARLTSAEIKTVSDEIETFKANALKFAGSSAVLAAHYNRLYAASRNSLKRLDREQRSAQNQEYKDSLKKARENGKSASVPGQKAAKAS